MNILIVDDSRLNVKLIEDILHQLQGDHYILKASSGEEAVEIMKSNEVNVVLLDLVMPGMSGLDVLKIMKQTELMSQKQVIMVTKVEDLEILRECFELGAKDFIRTPFNALEFSVRVQAVISSVEKDTKLNKALSLLENQNVELKRINQSLKDTQSYVVEKEKITAIGSLLKNLSEEIEKPIDYSLMELNHLRDTLDQLSLPLEVNFKSLENIEKQLGSVQKRISAIKAYFDEDEKGGFIYVTLCELVDDVIFLMSRELSNISELVRDYREEQMIYCNPLMLKQAIKYIVENAVEAVKELPRSRIEIKTFSNSGAVFLIVEDNGEPVIGKATGRVFEPFFTTKSKQHHMGLGLSIAYDIIVNKLGGNIELEQLEKTTRVSVAFIKK
ncbi:MAG: hypothetical protein BGO41_07565 [Clostridiales bacterium 38-18]|nr:MAG: hypothetical protein BGO41_07565 [Clostridiales bacterium 38-18]